MAGSRIRGCADLRAAVRRGLLLLDVEGLGGVELTGKVLRYDPALSFVERGKLVLAILRTL